MALKVKLTKSYAGASEDMLGTIKGLGLKKFGDERLLKDTPAIRGMAFKVKHLVSLETVSTEAPAPKRRKPRKIALRDRARAYQAKQDKA
ncbi:50S ribosomal protein L30 [Myxococcus sp. K15C18031901]|uniref:50S ribosomal protein L30 n=1 Tax=Myxococcus dinghuensis TaxID=2906761 RepID=UPI0020A7989F|nr:50S ribosomal protein L30 [Myxococcus dinghuensis]MCP3101570.1 50S ribosomal protein L30 [Myxococcus dinghuensis]